MLTCSLRNAQRATAVANKLHILTKNYSKLSHFTIFSATTSSLSSATSCKLHSRCCSTLTTRHSTSIIKSQRCNCSNCISTTKIISSCKQQREFATNTSNTVKPSYTKSKSSTPIPVKPLPTSNPIPKKRAGDHNGFAAAPPTITLNAVLKKFNLLVHPDMFQSTPEHAAANQLSLQSLNSLLSTLKTRELAEAYPPRQHLKLVFHVKKKRGDERWVEYIRTHDLDTHLTVKPLSQHQQQRMNDKKLISNNARGARIMKLPARGTETLDGEFYIIPVVISTNGGQCKGLVQKQLATLFYRCGLPYQFEWDEEYWKMTGVRNLKDSVQDEDERLRKAEEQAEKEENY